MQAGGQVFLKPARRRSPEDGNLVIDDLARSRRNALGDFPKDGSFRILAWLVKQVKRTARLEDLDLDPFGHAGGAQRTNAVFHHLLFRGEVRQEDIPEDFKIGAQGGDLLPVPLFFLLFVVLSLFAFSVRIRIPDHNSVPAVDPILGRAFNGRPGQVHPFLIGGIAGHVGRRRRGIGQGETRKKQKDGKD